MFLIFLKKSSILLYLEHKISFIISSCFILKLYMILKNTTLFYNQAQVLWYVFYSMAILMSVSIVIYEITN